MLNSLTSSLNGWVIQIKFWRDLMSSMTSCKNRKVRWLKASSFLNSTRTSIGSFLWERSRLILVHLIFKVDKKAIYKEFMKNSRKTLEKLHPSLIMNICSYTNHNIFLSMAKLRRVSKIFNYIFKTPEIREYLACKDLGVGIEK